jgi:hypothetical protein
MGILSFTARQADVLASDGYEVAQDLAHWSYEDITSWVTHKEKTKVGNATVYFGDMKRKSLAGLAWWVTEKTRCGETIDLAEFDDETRRSAVVEAKTEHEDAKAESQASKPDKFKYSEWTELENSVYTYLLSLKNPLGVPLAYVIRKDSMYYDIDPRTASIISNASLAGAVFRSDSQKVLTLLKTLTNGTDAENWMKGKSCGRDAMSALQAHYDGEAEAEKRKEAARSDLKVLLYRNEALFSFEKYLNRMKRCFDILEKYGVPYYEEDKVKLLLDRIQTSHAEVKTQVSICRSNHAASFVDASTYMSKEISRIFPTSNVGSVSFGKGPRSKQARNVSSSAINRRGRKRLIGTSNNGVDISDTTRYFSKDEWRKLDDDVKTRILEDPERAKKKQARQAKKKISSVSSDSTPSVGSEVSITKEAEDRIVAAVLRATKEQADLPPAQGPRHGSRISSMHSSNRSQASSVTFEPGTRG